jgi:hypothetical protein
MVVIIIIQFMGIYYCASLTAQIPLTKPAQNHEYNTKVYIYIYIYKKTRSSRHFVPPSFLVYDQKHWSMKCFKGVFNYLTPNVLPKVHQVDGHRFQLLLFLRFPIFFANGIAGSTQLVLPFEYLFECYFPGCVFVCTIQHFFPRLLPVKNCEC